MELNLMRGLMAASIAITVLAFLTAMMFAVSCIEAKAEVIPNRLTYAGMAAMVGVVFLFIAVAVA